jgi:hypothetical protein
MQKNQLLKTKHQKKESYFSTCIFFLSNRDLVSVLYLCVSHFVCECYATERV